MSSKSGRLARLVRDPLIHFALAGALIYAGYFAFAEPEETENPATLTVATGDVEWLMTSFSKRWGRAPTRTELDGLIDQHVKEQLLYREALKLGLDQDDVIIRRRMAQKLEFLVVDLLASADPTDEQLHAYFEENNDRYLDEPTIDLTQIFFDPDKRGNATLADAEVAKAALEAAGDAPLDTSKFGDGFLLQTYFASAPKTEISRLFGSGFADPVFELEQGIWHGPILSGYGTHVVYVHNLQAPEAPRFEDIREEVLVDWADAERKRMNDKFVQEIIANYVIEIEEPPNLELTPEKGDGA